MLKVKFFRATGTGADSLEGMVNEFIADKEIVDIKYQSGIVYTNFCNGGYPTHVQTVDSIMIMYKEKENA